jgi:hypothetical protein
MPLPTSGQISIDNVRTEFGGNSVGSLLKDYYRNGGLVPNIPLNKNIPLAGRIRLSDFYGTKKSVSVVQKIIFTQRIDGSDFYDFSALDNQLVIRHRKWQNPTFPATLIYTTISEDETLINSGKISIKTWKTKLPFALIKTTNVQFKFESGRAKASMTQAPSLSNKWKTIVLLDDDGPKAAATYSFSLTFTGLLLT